VDVLALQCFSVFNRSSHNLEKLDPQLTSVSEKDSLIKICCKMAEKTRILILGATGYMHVLVTPILLPVLTLNSGGSILTELIDRGVADKYDISALVRKPYHSSILKDQGINPIIFKDLDDFEGIREAAKDHDSMFPGLLDWLKLADEAKLLLLLLPRDMKVVRRLV
jgi:hypothetical protein